MKWLLRLYPLDWRQRFGAEVEELLATSPRPYKDRLDLLLKAAQVRLDQLTWEEKLRLLIALRLLLAVLVGAGLALSWVAATQLRDGLQEFPQHWWSAGSVGLTLLALTVLAATYRFQRRDRLA